MFGFYADQGFLGMGSMKLIPLNAIKLLRRLSTRSNRTCLRHISILAFSKTNQQNPSQYSQKS
jgi:hypothetical protein